MTPITISPRTKTVYFDNPISGAFWSEQLPLKGFEVSGGGYFFTTTHMTMKSAIKEKEIRESMISKFPFVTPLSKKEVL